MEEVDALIAGELWSEAAERLATYVREESSAEKQAEGLTRRAEVLSRQKKYTEALADARRAVELAPSSWSAHMRKGMSAFALEEYEVALAAFESAEARAESAPKPVRDSLRSWVRKCRAELELDDASSVPAPLLDAPVAESPAKAADAPPSAAPFVRHAFYQSMDTVYCDFFCKGRSADDVQTTFSPQSFHIRIRTQPDDVEGGAVYARDFTLAHPVDEARCVVSVGRVKIEVRLPKATVAHWDTFELAADGRAAVASPYADPSGMNKSMYPSSRPQKIDWSALEKEIPEDKLEGEAALNQVFKDIYKNASDEQRRAMVKSFTESGGTVLSTNWSEVGSKPVEGTPPKGLEMKKWGSD